MSQVFDIQRVRVRTGALDIEVAVALDVLHVTQGQADRVLELLPNLARHVCVNAATNSTFGAEIVGTELPHLLEHLIIELQGQVNTSNRQLTGHTSWLEELDVTGPHGYALMRTTVTFANDFVALQGLRDARDIILWLLDPSLPVPDVVGIRGRLAAIESSRR